MSFGSSIVRATLMALLLTCASCAKNPTMRLSHAEVTGLRISFPPAAGVLMRVVVDVYNPNPYDVAIRAVRGHVLLNERHTVTVDFKADGDGLWLPSDQTTKVAVPVDLPLEIALAVLRESETVPQIPYRFSGRADVTATRTFELEKDDYSVDERGFISRQQIQDAVPFQ
jgi:hypothetical protein